VAINQDQQQGRQPRSRLMFLLGKDLQGVELYEIMDTRLLASRLSNSNAGHADFVYELSGDEAFW
jgi:hypothetical protein